MKRKQSEKSLANLKPPFNSITAREAGRKGGKKKKENEPKRKAIEQLKNEIIEKSFSQVWDKLRTGEFEDKDLINVFKAAIDMSGFKTSKHEVENTGINIVVADKNHQKMLEDL